MKLIHWAQEGFFLTALCTVCGCVIGALIGAIVAFVTVASLCLSAVPAAERSLQGAFGAAFMVLFAAGVGGNIGLRYGGAIGMLIGLVRLVSDTALARFLMVGFGAGVGWFSAQFLMESHALIIGAPWSYGMTTTLGIICSILVIRIVKRIERFRDGLGQT